MAITVYGRRRIRAIERATGERIVHAAGPWVTTVDHRHLEWLAEEVWLMLPPAEAGVCAPGVALSSCRTMFGTDEAGARRHFMLGACDVCGAGPTEQHRHNCRVLLDLLARPSINPDYWPRPVHRPLWQDDPRRARARA